MDFVSALFSRVPWLMLFRLHLKSYLGCSVVGFLVAFGIREYWKFLFIYFLKLFFLFGLSLCVFFEDYVVVSFSIAL